MDEPVFPSILYQQQGLMGVAKPAGIHVFGPGSLASWLVSKYPDLAKVGPEQEPCFVHRLDHGTSGLLLAARDQETYDYLRELFGSTGITKTYLAVVEGELKDPVTVDKPLGGRYRRSSRVWVDDGSRRLRGVRPARTHVHPLGCSDGFCLCRVNIPTGTRHQIRAHLSHLGHPVLGDRLYGSTTRVTQSHERLFLHAYSLEFNVPKYDDRLCWECPLDAELKSFLAEHGLDLL